VTFINAPDTFLTIKKGHCLGNATEVDYVDSQSKETTDYISDATTPCVNHVSQ